MNRAKPGGLYPTVLEAVFRVDPGKVPAYVGVETPMGYSLVKLSKVVEPEKIDEAQRKSLGDRLRQAVAAGELNAAITRLREKVGVRVKRDALEKKNTSQQ